MDLGAARLGVLEFLDDQYARATGDDKSVTIDVVRARSHRCAIVEFRGHCAHCVEQVRHRPVEVLMAAGEDHVLFAELDQFVGIADAMRRRRTGRRDRVIHAVDFEPRRKRRGSGGRHRFRHRERSNPLRAGVLARDIRGLDDGAGRRATGTHDDAGPLVGDVVFAEAGVGDRLFHGDMVPGSPLGKEAQGAAIDEFARVERRRAPDLATKSMLGKLVGEADAGFGVTQRSLNLGRIVSD